MNSTGLALLAIVAIVSLASAAHGARIQVTEPEIGYSAFDEDMIMGLIGNVCGRQVSCPAPRYATKSLRDWDRETVMRSDVVDQFRRGKIPIKNFRSSFAKEFCCSTEQCLASCGFQKKVEKPLIAGFPHNMPYLMSLEIPEIERHETAIHTYLSRNGFKKSKIYPAEIEELFDDLHRNSDKIEAILEERRRSRKQF